MFISRAGLRPFLVQWAISLLVRLVNWAEKALIRSVLRKTFQHLLQVQSPLSRAWLGFRWSFVLIFVGSIPNCFFVSKPSNLSCYESTTMQFSLSLFLMHFFCYLFIFAFSHFSFSVFLGCKYFCHPVWFDGKFCIWAWIFLFPIGIFWCKIYV